MLKKILKKFPQYVTHSKQYTDVKPKNVPKWGEINKENTTFDNIEYGFKREITPADLKMKEKTWWIP